MTVSRGRRSTSTTVTVVALLTLILLVEAVASSMSLSQLGKGAKTLSEAMYALPRQGLVNGAYYTYVNSTGAPLVAVVLVNPNPDWVDVALVGVVAGRAENILDNGTVIGVGGAGRLVRINWGPGFNGTGVRIPPHSVAYVYAMLPGLPADLSACTNPGGCTKLTKTGPGEFIEMKKWKWHQQPVPGVFLDSSNWSLVRLRRSHLRFSIFLFTTQPILFNESQITNDCFLCCGDCGILDLVKNPGKAKFRVIVNEFDSNHLYKCPKIVKGYGATGILSPNFDPGKGYYHYLFYLSMQEDMDPKFTYETSIPQGTPPGAVKNWSRSDDDSSKAPQEWFSLRDQQCGRAWVLVTYRFDFKYDRYSTRLLTAGDFADYYNASGVEMYVQYKSYQGVMHHKFKLWRLPLGTADWYTETNLTLTIGFYANDTLINTITLMASRGAGAGTTITVPNETTSIVVLANVSLAGPGVNTGLCRLSIPAPYPFSGAGTFPEVMYGQTFVAWLTSVWPYCGYDSRPAYNAAFQLDIYPYNTTG